MKITKRDLKKIIKEELEEGSREQMMMPAVSQSDLKLLELEDRVARLEKMVEGSGLEESSLGSTLRRSSTADQNLETLTLAQKTQEALMNQLKVVEDPSEQEKIQRRLKLLLKLVDDLKLG